MLILECSQGCYGRTDGRKDERTDGSVTISLRNFVGEGIISKQLISGEKTTCLYEPAASFRKQTNVNEAITNF